MPPIYSTPLTTPHKVYYDSTFELSVIPMQETFCLYGIRDRAYPMESITLDLASANFLYEKLGEFLNA